jgi:hypothetical protein
MVKIVKLCHFSLYSNLYRPAPSSLLGSHIFSASYSQILLICMRFEVLTAVIINSLNPSGYYSKHLLEHIKTLQSACRVYICDSYACDNKQRYFS